MGYNGTWERFLTKGVIARIISPKVTLFLISTSICLHLPRWEGHVFERQAENQIKVRMRPRSAAKFSIVNGVVHF